MPYPHQLRQHSRGEWAEDWPMAHCRRNSLLRALRRSAATLNRAIRAKFGIVSLVAGPPMQGLHCFASLWEGDGKSREKWVSAADSSPRLI